MILEKFQSEIWMQEKFGNVKWTIVFSKLKGERFSFFFFYMFCLLLLFCLFLIPDKNAACAAIVDHLNIPKKLLLGCEIKCCTGNKCNQPGNVRIM